MSLSLSSLFVCPCVVLLFGAFEAFEARCFKGVTKVPTGCSKGVLGVSRMFQRCYKGASRMFHACLKGGSRVFNRVFFSKEVSRIIKRFQVFFKEVSGCVKSISRVFSRKF